VVKFIIETGYLTDEEIKKATELVLLSGADFVKTCSGYGPRGATIHDVELIKEVIDKIPRPNITSGLGTRRERVFRPRIKVAGGIDTYQEAIDFINAGADRIGTSHAVEIIEGCSTLLKENINSLE
jgi:deoxyribose-phosphate aldolase